MPQPQEMRVWSMGWEDPLEESMATHSSILAWRILWTEEPGGLQFMGSQRVGCNSSDLHTTGIVKDHIYVCGCSVQFSCSVVSDSLRPHELQHARPPCLSPTPGVHWDSRPLSQWCHPAISSFVVPFSSCPQSLSSQGMVSTSWNLLLVLIISLPHDMKPTIHNGWETCTDLGGKWSGK